MCKYTCTKCVSQAYKASHDSNGGLPVIMTLDVTTSTSQHMLRPSAIHYASTTVCIRTA